MYMYTCTIGTATLRDLLWWHRVVDGSYEPTIEHVLRVSGLQKADVLEAQFDVGVLRPSYYLAKDDAKRRVFLVIRGTHSLHDVRDTPSAPCATRAHRRCWRRSRVRIVRLHATTCHRC